MLVRFARVKDRTIGALVLDDHFALAEHPLGEKGGDWREGCRLRCAGNRHQIVRIAVQHERVAQTGTDAVCERPRPLRIIVERTGHCHFAFCRLVRAGVFAGAISGGALPASRASISRTIRSESSDCRTIESSSSEMACGSRSEIEF